MIKRSLIAAPATDPTPAWPAPTTTGPETARATQVTAAAPTSKCVPAASIWTHGPHLPPPGKIHTPDCQYSLNYIHAYIYTYV